MVEPDVDEYYGALNDYVRMAANGITNAIVVEAPNGIGKSYQITNTLRDEVGEHGFVTHQGYVSPLELYHTLYDGRNRVIFLDDVSGVFDDERAMSLLKAAMWGQGDSDERIVSWQTTSSKIEVDEQFRFTGQIIICVNRLQQDAHVKAVKSRALSYNLSFKHDERMALIREVAKAPYEDLDLDERTEIAQWLTEISSEMLDVNLRTLIHCYDLYRFNQDSWRERATELIGLDEDVKVATDLRNSHEHIREAARQFGLETDYPTKRFFDVLGKAVELELVKELETHIDTANDAISMYSELTEKSRKTYYRRREELVENGEI